MYCKGSNVGPQIYLAETEPNADTELMWTINLMSDAETFAETEPNVDTDLYKDTKPDADT